MTDDTGAVPEGLHAEYADLRALIRIATAWPGPLPAPVIDAVLLSRMPPPVVTDRL